MSAISNSICRAYNFAREQAPTIASPQQMIRNAQKVALPAIALAAMSSLPVVDGGPWAACICILACLPLAEAPPLYAACLTACGVALVTPTP